MRKGMIQTAITMAICWGLMIFVVAAERQGDLSGIWYPLESLVIWTWLIVAIIIGIIGSLLH